MRRLRWRAELAAAAASRRSLAAAGRRLGRACLRLALLLAPLAATAQSFERLSPYEEGLYGERVFVNGDYNTLRNVRTYWQRESVRLRHMRGCEFSLCGNGDAILRVTIPTRLLFAPNDTVLTAQADASLRPFLNLVRGDAPMASLVVTCHSDNNGSERYLDATTAARARSVERWMQRQGVRPARVCSYGAGHHCPRGGDATVASRERNRRMTLYFVPGKEMLKLARKDKLNNTMNK